MQGVTEEQAAWLREKVTHASKGMNTIVVTHMPNLARAFPEFGAEVAGGKALVFRLDGKGGTQLIARVKMEEWPRLRS